MDCADADSRHNSNKENISSLRQQVLKKTQDSVEERKKTLLLGLYQGDHHNTPEARRSAPDDTQSSSHTYPPEYTNRVTGHNSEDPRLRQHQEELHVAQEHIKKLLVQQDTSRCEMVQLQNKLVTTEAKYQQLKREQEETEDSLHTAQTTLQRLERENEEVTEQWDTLVTGMEGFRKELHHLTADNERLQTALQVVLEENGALLKEQLEKKETAAKLTALESTWEQTKEQHQRYTTLFEREAQLLKTAVASSEALLVENQQLKDLLVTARQQCQEWEARCMAQRCSITVDREVLLGSPEPNGVPLSPTEDNSSEGLLRSLESKVVDLTLSLQHSQQEAEQWRLQYEAAVRLPLIQASVITTCHATVTAARPLSETLLHENKSLSSKLTATEHFSTTLLDVYQTLLTLFGEETIRSRKLEDELRAERERKPTREPYYTSNSGNGISSTRRERRKDASFILGRGSK